MCTPRTAREHGTSGEVPIRDTGGSANHFSQGRRDSADRSDETGRSPVTSAPSFLIERLDYAGRRTRQEVFRGAMSQHWEVVATDARGRHQHSAHRSATLVDLVAALPQLHRVTRGVVWILSDGLEAHGLLGALRVVDAAHEPAVPERWFAEPSATSPLEAFRDEDDEYVDGSWGGTLQLVPRWIRVNDERAVVARADRRAALLLLDQEGDPVITRPAFEWGFYGESGGPCSWDGGAAAGWCGPSLWVHHRWGDLDPERSLSRRSLAGSRGRG